MLRTFDENLVITAVQQLTTDLDSMSARIKKLEEGGGGGGLKKILSKTYENVDITNTTEQEFDTIYLPSEYVFSPEKMLLMVINFINEEANPKVLNTILTCFNLSGKLSGSLTADQSGHIQYTNSAGTLMSTTNSEAIYWKDIKLPSYEIKLYSKYNSNRGVIKGTALLNIYEIELPIV